MNAQTKITAADTALGWCVENAWPTPNELAWSVYSRFDKEAEAQEYMDFWAQEYEPSKFDGRRYAWRVVPYTVEHAARAAERSALINANLAKWEASQ
jgi:hypothetical protein